MMPLVGSIIITSNKSFGKWAELMSDEAFAKAMLEYVGKYIRFM